MKHELHGRSGKRTTRLSRTAVLTLFLLSITASGCSVRGYAVGQVGDVLAASGGGFGADDDPELVRAAAPFSLKLMEGVLSGAPRHVGLLGAAASGFTQYAYAFVHQDADEAEALDVTTARTQRSRARGLYRRARDYGLRALDAEHPGFALELQKDPRHALSRLSREDSVRLYWTTAAWTAVVSLSQDSPAMLADLGLVDLMVKTLQRLDPDMDYGSLHTFLISYEMARPGAQNPEARARFHFEEAVRLSAGQKAGPFVAFAEGACVAAQNRAEFVALLRAAMAIDPAARREWQLENRIMQRRARWLLARVDELFIE